MRLIFFFTVFEKGGNPVITVFQKGSWFDERQTASKLSDSLNIKTSFRKDDIQVLKELCAK
jgi:hypothetical protein